MNEGNLNGHPKRESFITMYIKGKWEIKGFGKHTSPRT